MEIDVPTKLDVLQATVEDLDVRVERMDDALRGNGEGLVTRVAVLDRRVLSLEEYHAEIKSIRRWFSLGVLGLFGTIAWQMVEFWILSRPN